MRSGCAPRRHELVYVDPFASADVTTMDFLGPLEKFQTLIVGGLGIIGVVGTIYGNARAVRNRDDRLRDLEAQSIAAALYGEIILLRREMADIANFVANVEMRGGEDHPVLKFDAHFLERNKLPDPLLYKSLASKLGLLRPSLLLPITEFYGQLETMRAWLPRLVKTDERRVGYSPLAVLEPAEKAIFDIKPTLEAIERDLKVPAPAEDPPFGRASAIIESERMRFEEAKGH